MMSAPAPLLAVDKLSVFYDAFQAVHDVDLTVGAGEIVSIIGANGAGKSSFLKALVRQAGRVTGAALFDGEDLSAFSTRDIVAKGIALVPEGRKLFPSLTVLENLRIGWELGRRRDIGLDEIFGWFPVLAERRDQRARELSGGQQ
ncbi:MAG TPA: ATP-binding cassette domain-containing protein, partial [Roseiarcus sp.]|nr:ATP-binding cassette domain-containing protein [Roseiarcus sp.]